MASEALEIGTEELEDGRHRLTAEGPAEAVEFCFMLLVGTLMQQDGVEVSDQHPDDMDVSP